jgi:membrane protein
VSSQNQRQTRSDDDDTDGPDSPTDLPKSSLKDVLRRARVEFRRDHLTDLAAGLTYYATLSAVPGLIVLVAILGLLGPDTTSQLTNQVQSIAPGSSAEVVSNLINQAQSNRTGAGIGAVVGLLVALYDIEEGRPIWKTLPIRVGLTVLAVVVIVISVVIVVVSGPVAQQVGDIIGVGDAAVTVWSVLKWPVMLVLVAVLLAILFWASPNAKQGGVRWVSPGGVIAVLIWVGASALFAVYVTHFASYDKTYGSLGGVVIFLVWLWLTNIALLLGVEINAELDRSRAIAEGVSPDAEPFAEPRDTRKLDPEDKAAVEEVARQRSNDTH